MIYFHLFCSTQAFVLGSILWFGNGSAVQSTFLFAQPSFRLALFSGKYSFRF